MKDAGTLRPEHVSLGKMGNVRGAIEVARGAPARSSARNGITLEYPVIRHMNNLESVLTYEGTHEVHTLVVGRADRRKRVSLGPMAGSSTHADRAGSRGGHVRAAILDGELRPGQRVNREAWAERARVSLIQCEALRGAAGEGLVTYRPRRGYAVTELDPASSRRLRLRNAARDRRAPRGVALPRPRTCVRSAGGGTRARAQLPPAMWPGSSPPTGASTTGSTCSREASLGPSDVLWDPTEADCALSGLPGEAAAAGPRPPGDVAAVAAVDVPGAVRSTPAGAVRRAARCGPRPTASPSGWRRMGRP